MGTLDWCTAETNEFENGPGALVPGPGTHALTTSSAEPPGQGRRYCQIELVTDRMVQ